MSSHTPERRRPRLETPSQTIGPFFHPGLLHDTWKLPEHSTAGCVRLAGRVLDGQAQPVEDALIEVWSSTRVATPEAPTGLRRFARCASSSGGEYALETARPDLDDDLAGSVHAPHLMLRIFARGILTPLCTRIYLEDQAANARDPLLERVPEERRSTLIAELRTPDCYALDLILQGPGETVFFDV